MSEIKNIPDTPQSAQDRVAEITDKLEAGLKALFEGDNFRQYLNTMSKFHNYSFNNTMLIALQKPDATLVAGFNSWKKNFERSVNNGEKGIKIFAPAPYKKKKVQEKIDPETDLPVLDKDGKPVMEEVEITIPAFKVVSVFDVSQTNGKELPTLGVDELKGNVENFEKFFGVLKEVSPVPIKFAEIDGSSKGFYHQVDKDITIKQDMPEVQTIKTAIHEIAHAKLHDHDLRKADIDSPIKDRNTEEVEAESIAYTVCQHFGIDTADYSFAYVASWGSGKDTPELKASLETIRSTASELITQIEGKLRGLEKEKTVEQESEVSTAPAQAKKADNIIGNTPYKDIPNKFYIKIPTGSVPNVEKLFESEKISYSGRKAKSTTTITINEADYKNVSSLLANAGVSEIGLDKSADSQKGLADKQRETVVINAFGGAGAGKTTACMHIAAELKKKGFVAEYVPEYAKELVWDKNFEMLDGSEMHQRMVLSEQSRRLERLVGQVDFIVTDAPTLLNGVYLNDCDNKENYCKMLLENFNTYNNFNFVVQRDSKNFEKEGRIHTLEESIAVDGEVEKLLKDNNLFFGKYDHDHLDTVVQNSIKTYEKLNGIQQSQRKQAPKQEQDKNIIGNTEYKNISDKFFIRMSASKAQEISAVLEANGLHFSGRIEGDKATITISKADKETYKQLTAFPSYSHEKLVKSARETLVGAMKEYDEADKAVAIAEEKLNNAVQEYDEVKDENGQISDPALKNKVMDNIRSAAMLKEAADKNFSEKSASLDIASADFKALAAPESPVPECMGKLPDESLSIGQMEEYGYKFTADNEMLPLGTEKATQFLELGAEVYRLYEDNTEGLVQSPAEISEHKGLLGIEKAEWERLRPVVEHFESLNAAQSQREDFLINGDVPASVGIYQLNEWAETRDIRYMNSEYLESKGIVPERDKYTLVYSFEAVPEDLSNRAEFLGKVFEKFNSEPPKDYSGRSISVSDVVVIRNGDDLSAHYVDSIGFKELENFGEVHRKPEKSAKVQPKPAPAKPEAEKKPSVIGAIEELKKNCSKQPNAKENEKGAVAL